MLPFSHSQFLNVFSVYNEAVWPAQIAAYALAVGILVVALRPTRHSGRLAAAGLSVMWLWTGVVYHGIFFSNINSVALGFAVIFIAQEILLIEAGVVRNRLQFGQASRLAKYTGLALVFYAMALYPALGLLTGQRYPAMPSFGITPCPVTLFTLGILLLAAPDTPKRLWVLPVAWALVGGSAAWLLSVPQDWILLISPLSLFALRRSKNALPSS